ncbi:MAG: ABC transporter permease, partial [bacterium]
MNDELEFHFQMRTEELMHRGMSRSDARREAEREFGDQELTRRYCERLDRDGERETRRLDWLRELWQDLRLVVRGIRLRPGFAAIVILTIALGVGANTAVFSVLDSVLLKRLPFPRADRVVTVDELNMQTHNARSDIAAGEYLDWVRDQKSLEGIAVHGARNLTFAGGTVPELLVGRRVSANFFDVLGVKPLAGRFFNDEESRYNAPKTVVLGHQLWERRFASDRTIVGRSIILDGQGVTVIGVLPASFDFAATFTPGRQADVFFPFPLSSETNRQGNTLALIGRLRDGVSFEAAQSEASAIATRHNPDVVDGRSINGFKPRVST